MAPTIMAKLGSWSGSGNLVATGVTLTPSGSGLTAQVNTPYYPDGFSSANQKAVHFDGVTGRMTGGTSAGHSQTSFTICIRFKVDNIVGSKFLASVYGTSTDSRQWAISIGNAATRLYVYNGASSAVTTTVNVAANVWNVCCFVFDSDAAVVRSQVNNTATSNVAAFSSINAASSTEFVLGSDGGAPSSFFPGDIADIAFFPVAFTTAQMTAAVRSMMSGQVLTVTRAAVETAVPVAGSAVSYYLPNDTVTVTEQGVQLHGAVTSRIIQNQRLSSNVANGGIGGVGTTGWTVRGTAVCDPTSVLAPDGSMTAERITVAAYGSNDIYQSSGGFTVATPVATAIWVKRVSTSGSLRIANRAGGGSLGQWSVNLANLPDAWVRLTANSPYVSQSAAFVSTTPGGGAGLQIASMDTNALTVDVWRPWQVEKNAAGPDFEVGAATVGRLITGCDIANPMGSTPTPFGIVFTATAPWGDNGLGCYLFRSVPVGSSRISGYVTSTKAVALLTEDASAVATTWVTAVQSLTPETEHTFAFQYDPLTHSAQIALDGTSLSTTKTGADFAPPSSIGNISLGRGVSTVFNLSGSMKRCSIYWPVTDISKCK